MFAHPWNNSRSRGQSWSKVEIWGVSHSNWETVWGWLFALLTLSAFLIVRYKSTMRKMSYLKVLSVRACRSVWLWRLAAGNLAGVVFPFLLFFISSVRSQRGSFSSSSSFSSSWRSFNTDGAICGQSLWWPWLVKISQQDTADAATSCDFPSSRQPLTCCVGESRDVSVHAWDISLSRRTHSAVSHFARS